MSMPAQRPGRSESTVETPADFMAAVEAKFGPIVLDLAATAENAKAERFFTPQDDSLKQCWADLPFGNRWLNPPYSDIAPWVKRAFDSYTTFTPVLVLVPASVGSNWWADYVHEKCCVYLLRPRLTFVGHKSSYPKDLALLEYGTPSERCGEKFYSTWRWK